MHRVVYLPLHVSCVCLPVSNVRVRLCVRVVWLGSITIWGSACPAVRVRSLLAIPAAIIVTIVMLTVWLVLALLLLALLVISHYCCILMCVVPVVQLHLFLRMAHAGPVTLLVKHVLIRLSNVLPVIQHQLFPTCSITYVSQTAPKHTIKILVPVFAVFAAVSPI